MQTSINVSLGGRQYEVQRLPMRPAKAFRERALALLNEYATAVREAGSFELVTAQGEFNLGGLQGLLEQTQGLLLDVGERGLDLLCAYSPAVAGDRERIAEQAFDEEVLAAAVEVLKLAFPFAEKLPALLKAGLAASTTSTSSPSANGASTPAKTPTT